VVGAQVATRRVPDGALVELDGDTGELRILR
jgi:phosphohistidine swiveling domain-containing protein